MRVPEAPSAFQALSGEFNAQVINGAATLVKNVINYAPPPVDPDKLARARARLAEMPTDKPTEPGGLPEGSPPLSLGRNPHFVGREDDLLLLARALKGGETVAITQPRIAAATGLGGIGKTQLAAGFVHRYGQYFLGGAFWLSFADADLVPTILADFANCGALELSPHVNTLNAELRAQAVLAAWQGEMPRLLVFDNCESEELLEKWRPKAGGARVIVTSRRSEWDPILGVTTLPLGVLSRDESVALLRKHRPDLAADDPDLDAIASELGDLPLALSLAGHYLHRYLADVTPAEYLAELRRESVDHLSLQEGGISPTGHEQSVARTFLMSYERLEDGARDRLARALLARAAYLSPGRPFPRDLLRATVTPITGEPPTKIAVGQAIGRLLELGLLEQDETESLRLHQLLSEFVRRVSADGEAAEAVESTLIREVRRPDLTRDRRKLLGLMIHLVTAMGVLPSHQDSRAANLYSSVGHGFNLLGIHGAAQPFFERALEIFEETLGSDDPATVAALIELAMTYAALGEVGTAKSLAERALAICVRALGPDNPITVEVRGNLTRAMSQMEKYRELYSRRAALQGWTGEASRHQERTSDRKSERSSTGPEH